MDLVTVPTTNNNNKEREATAEQKAWDELARLTSGVGPAANWRWSIPANPDRDSDLILAAGLKALADERDALAARRPPVSGDNAERPSAVTNAMLRAAVLHLKEYYEVRSSHGNLRWIVPDGEVRAALEAALSASQPREAAPSDTDPEAVAYAIWNAEGTFEPGGVDDRLAEWAADRDEYLGIAERVLATLPLLSRTSHPVQVEVSDDMVDALDALPVGTVVGFVGGAAHREYAGSMLLWISTDGGRDQYARTLAHRRGALTPLTSSWPSNEGAPDDQQ